MQTDHVNAPCLRSSRRSTLAATTARMIQLPGELLIDVFVLACGHDLEQKLHLAQVCAYWRAVALDYPTFWARIVVRTSRDAARLPISLARSGDRPLDVELYSQRHTGTLSSSDERAVVDALMAPNQRLRLKRLFMSTSGSEPLLAILGSGLDFPALEDLEIRTSDTQHRLAPRLEAPTVRRLMLSGLKFVSGDSLITPSLEHLYLGVFVEDGPWKLLSTIMRRCTALHHLEWNVAAFGLVTSDALPGPVLPRLYTLRLGVRADSSDVLRVFKHHNITAADLAVTIRSRDILDDETSQLLEDIFSRTGAVTLVDLRVESDESNLQIVIRDDVGRVRRLIVFDDYGRWNMRDIWTPLVRLYAIDKSLRSLHMRTSDWHGFAGAFSSRPPVALGEVHILLRGGIEVKEIDLAMEDENYDWTQTVLPPPRTLHLPNIRKIVIVDDGWGTIRADHTQAVTRVREILQHIECDASSRRVEVCVSVPAVLSGRGLSQMTQTTLLDGLAHKWTLCSHCTGV
ncbi:hypothetical protein EXIGLDRAFT_77629 [Exidia glandulosa HHB12029]|uniref:F-box domain-containing protein n=1 Tax=Exidia glandulosa HHB12029 TaxID=1314781 RepID=A0A165NY53_EXIGL|nr:hypothetical protein EXIGLDRAFT_77629 [Exidia glandulosa HHB12029]